MYQGTEYDLDAVTPDLITSGLFSSLCTITETTGILDEAGAPVPDPYTPLAGHSLIPCMSPPLSFGMTVRPRELKALEEILSKNMLQLFLAGYYPAITEQHRAVVGKSDGAGGIATPETYDIVGVEWDSQNRLTRLAVELATI